MHRDTEMPRPQGCAQDMEIIGYHLQDSIRGQAVSIFQVLIGACGLRFHHYSLCRHASFNEVCGHWPRFAAARNNNLLTTIKS